MLAAERDCKSVLHFIDALGADQLEIRRRCDVWEKLSVELFGSEDSKEWLKSILIKNGAFWMFVTEKARKDSALLSLLVNAQIRGIRNSRTVLQQWAAPFQEKITDRSFDGWAEVSDNKEYAAESEGRPQYGIRRAATLLRTYKGRKIESKSF